MSMTEQQQRVNKLIERIERHQQALGLPDTRFVLRYQEFLRSADSWRRGLIERDWPRLGKGLPRWEEQLGRLVALLDGGQEIGKYFDALPIAKHVEILYDILDGQQTDRRVAFVIGPTGIGKSWAMKWMALQDPKHAVYVYANECWSESMAQIATGLANAVGAGVDKYSGKKTFAAVTDVLRAHAMTVLLDDVQKAGVLGLKLIKSLVDDTRAKFILGVYPSSWVKLVGGSTEALAEAQQILGRTIKPIDQRWMKGVTVEDVAAYMKAAGATGDLKVTAQRIHKDVRQNGNLRVLADAVSLARVNAEENDQALTAAYVQAALDVLCPKKQEENA